MPTAVFTTKILPSYDDLPELRYHFPRTYLNQAREAVGDWILYYEPRREDASSSGRAGRQAYFATARVVRIEEDRTIPNHYYAYVDNYLEFTSPVPFRLGAFYPESGLQKEDGSTNKGLFGRAVRLIPRKDYDLIVALGFAEGERLAETARKAEREERGAEEEIVYVAGKRKVEILERAFRDAAFTKSVQKVYSRTCAMTGLKLINGGGRCEIEAAHIRPVADDGPDSVRNGIALSRTVHWMFDRGILSIDDDGTILQARKLVPDPVRRLLNPEGRILLPSDRIAAPHPAFLRYHREHVFKGD